MHSDLPDSAPELRRLDPGERAAITLARDAARGRGSGGRSISFDVVPDCIGSLPEAGSIIVVLATDAPLLPIQCQRLARRATTGLAWAGGYGSNGSSDIFLAFATGNRIGQGRATVPVSMLAPDAMTPLFQAAAEAILNALCMAETVTGFRGRTAHALPLDLLQQVMGVHRAG